VNPIERLTQGDRVLAIIVRGEYRPTSTTFLTSPELEQQLGFVVHPAGERIPSHMHRPEERHLTGTSEVLVVVKGACEIELFDDHHVRVATRQLNQGDVVLLASGGHGFRMLQETVLLEIKQGPYMGQDEKDIFA
jgi:mannose-6-phosphate isomerase-like protein (cupin superfamily)